MFFFFSLRQLGYALIIAVLEFFCSMKCHLQTYNIIFKYKKWREEKNNLETH